MSYNWEEENVLLLLEKYQENDILWNPKNPDYKNRNKRTDTLNVIATLFGTNTSEIERKLKNLTSHYFRERKKVEETRRSGLSDEVREPRWFAYKALDFLRDKKRPPETTENIPSKCEHSTATGSSGNRVKSDKASRNTLENTGQDSPFLDSADDGTPEDEHAQELILPHFIGIQNIPQPTDVRSSNARVFKRKIMRDKNQFIAQKRRLTLDLLNHDIYLRKLQALKLEKELGMGRSEYTQELEAVKGIKTENTLDNEFDYYE